LPKFIANPLNYKSKKNGAFLLKHRVYLNVRIVPSYYGCSKVMIIVIF